MTAHKNRAASTGGSTAEGIFCRLSQLASLALVVLICATSTAQAQDEGNQYLTIYSLIQQGDSLSANGKTAAAAAKYREAQAALAIFQRDHRDWNPKLVSYRMNDLAAKLSPPAEKESVAVKSASAAGATKVRLLEPGAEPRKQLRFHPKPGDKQAISLTVKTAVDTKVGDMDTPSMKLPQMKMDLEALVKDVAANGDISYELVVADADALEQEGVLAPVVEAMRTALKSAKGMTGQCVASDRGISISAQTKAPATADAQAGQVVDQLKESFGRLTVPLPEEAIGAGARWEAKATLKSQGLTLDQTSVCELISLEGEIMKIKSTVTQRAGRQTFENPAAPGMKTELTKMTGTGSSEMTCDLARLLITGGEATAQAELSLTMNVAGQQQPMTVKTDTKVQIEGK